MRLESNGRLVSYGICATKSSLWGRFGVAALHSAIEMIQRKKRPIDVGVCCFAGEAVWIGSWREKAFVWPTPFQLTPSELLR
jgi:hypothetical protein